MPSVSARRVRDRGTYPEAIGRNYPRGAAGEGVAAPLSPAEIDAFMRELSREDCERNMRSFLQLSRDETLGVLQRRDWREQYDLRRRIIAARDFLGWEFADANPGRVLEALELTP